VINISLVHRVAVEARGHNGDDCHTVRGKGQARPAKRVVTKMPVIDETE
jgi:hypothetical protein